ncbi:hypothetical protein ZIOFF_067401 [Zingiber officinale]|uniref:Uncharacterized protein n=1 Tax=Zingiber officinale TaxID=94328 RepID=A0A8J5CDR9_ZINOF|nr:hypothetical protein ZIOFF_067401 [Zingiber officinale]
MEGYSFDAQNDLDRFEDDLEEEVDEILYGDCPETLIIHEYLLIEEDVGDKTETNNDQIYDEDKVEEIIEEADDDPQYSGGPNKQTCGFDIFDTYHPLTRINSSGASPNHNLCFDIVDANRVEFKIESDMGVGLLFHIDSTRASSVIAMDVICSGEEDSLTSAEDYVGDVANLHRVLDGFPSTLILWPMARYGEGDKRWIVKEHTDGTNIHNWH